MPQSLANERDPRIEVVEAKLSGDLAGALARVDSLLGGPRLNAALRESLSYLRARLLLELGPHHAGLRGLEEVAEGKGTLAPFARLRLAEELLLARDAEAAGEKIAEILTSSTADSSSKKVLGLLERALDAKVGCGLLAGVRDRQLDTENRRRLQLARARCLDWQGSPGHGEAGSEDKGSERKAGAIGSKEDPWMPGPTRPNEAARSGNSTRLGEASRADSARGDSARGDSARADSTRGDLQAPGPGSKDLLRTPPPETFLLELLAEDTADDVAFQAAQLLANDLDPKAASARTLFLIGLSFYEHREFVDASRWLAQALVRLPSVPDVSKKEIFDCRYALARSYFWLELWETAEKAYSALAADTTDPADKARVLYQRARVLELWDESRWPDALEAFGQAQAADPNGGFASAAIKSRLRLAWLLGREENALEALEALAKRRRSGDTARGLFFLVATELEKLALAEPVDQTGKLDRDAALDRIVGWLAWAEGLERLEKQELAYWRGRLEEARRGPEAAVEAYLEALVEDPYHPFGVAAWKRLSAEPLWQTTLVTGREKSTSAVANDLLAAGLVLGEVDPLGQKARAALLGKLAADRRAAPYLGLEEIPVGQWRLWRARLGQPEEQMLALGLFDEGASKVLRHFPVSNPALAFTGSLELSQAGMTRRSLYVAEILRQRMPASLPEGLLPRGYRRLLHPFGYSFLILRESQRREIDPNLLAAIIREESRYDPEAFSAASARGLTQFVYPTAKEIAAKIGLGPIEASDIHRPELAIALGAAYLRQLADDLASNRGKGTVEEVVAAYNAGEPQAQLWRRYCVGSGQEEYLSKIAFRETRHYVRRVLGSRARYTELYEREASE